MDPRFDGTNIRIVVAGEGTGSGRVTGPDMNCAIANGDSCSEEFVDAGAGGAFRLEAIPDSGSAFIGWSGACTGAICSLSFPQGKDTTFDVRLRFDRIVQSNVAPTVEVFVPEDGATFGASDTIEFRGRATDPEDGVVSAGLTWTSSVDGALCTTVAGVPCRRVLSPGQHVITLAAMDGAGASGSASVRITVRDVAANQRPEAYIGLPEDGASYQAGDTVSFLGSGTDPEDGTLSGLAGQLLWTSSVSGSLCTCTSFRSVLAAGIHTISLIATDTDGARDTARVTVTVTTSSLPGSISGRVTGNGYAVGGATLTLSDAGSATTGTDDGGFYSFANLPPGTYTVTVSVALNISFPAPSQTVTVGGGQAVVVNFVGTY